MRAGPLDQRITIQEATEGRGPAGDVTESWANRARIWAHQRDTRGQERIAAGAETVIADAVFSVRYRSWINPKMRIMADNLAWDIVAVAKVGRRDMLELTCTRVER